MIQKEESSEEGETGMELRRELAAYEEDYVMVRAAMEVLAQKYDELEERYHLEKEQHEVDTAELVAKHEQDRSSWQEVSRRALKETSDKLMEVLMQAVSSKKELLQQVQELQQANDQLRTMLNCSSDAVTDDLIQDRQIELDPAFGF
ncbi:MAG: hypothetical protein Q8P67_25305 [archaeon]|nr:hypothetical protein [archaeon]